MKRCILPLLVLLALADVADLGLLESAQAQQRRRYTPRRNNTRGRYSNNRNRYRNNRGRNYARGRNNNRYRGSQARQMQNARNQINRQIQAYRAAMQRQQQAVAQMQRDAANGIYTLNNGQKVVKGYRDYELVTSGDATVRMMELPVTFNADGKTERPSAEELKKLKGDKPNLVGYEAKFDDLAVGQLVRITCGTAKADPKDKEKTMWVAAGQVAGQIAAIDSSKIIVRVEGLVPQAAGKKIEKVAVTDREARLIVIVKKDGGTVNGGAAPATGGAKDPFGGFGDFGNFGTPPKK